MKQDLKIVGLFKEETLETKIQIDQVLHNLFKVLGAFKID